MMLSKLADAQHKIWSHWMKYLFEISIQNDDGTVTIPADKVKLWQRQIITPYKDLSDKEKESDIEQAQKILEILERKK